MKSPLRFFAPASLALAAMAALSSSSLAEQTCFSDWSEAAPIVRREGLAPMEQVGRLIRDRAAAEVVRSTLCRTDDRYFYRLTVRVSGGNLKMLVVDARNPASP